MMSWRWMLMAGTLMLLAFAIVLMPLAFAHGLAGSPLGRDASAFGPVWNGRLYTASAGPARFERVDVALRPVALLTGQAVFDWQVSDSGARGAGVAYAGLASAGLRETRLSGTFHALGLPLPGVGADDTLSLEIGELAFTGAGCVQAAGEVRTSALIGIASRYEVDAPLLQGPLSCEGGVLFADLSGTSADMEIRVTVSVAPSGLYRWSAEAVLIDASLTPVFSAAGFTQDGPVWRHRGEGQLA